MEHEFWLVVTITWAAVDLSQAARECKPCVNGDTSFQWEVLWLYAFFAKTTTPQPTVTQNGSNYVDLGKDVHYGVKMETFLYHLAPALKNHQNLANFGLDLEKIFARFRSHQ